MIQIEPAHRAIIEAILKSYPYTFYLFGSRATGTARRFSDIDLLYKDNIPSLVISNLREAFEESNLPFFVDIINWNACTPDFQAKIEKDLIQIWPA